MRYGVIGLVVAAACHHTEPPPASQPAKQAPVASAVPDLICPEPSVPSKLRGVDPAKGGYRVLDSDADVQAVRTAMEHGTQVTSAEQKSTSMRTLAAAMDDMRAEVQSCMVRADGAKPETQYELRTSVSGNSVATLIIGMSVKRVDGVNADHSPVLAATAAEPCIQHLFERLELPPGDWSAMSMTIVRQDFCTPTVEIAFRATRGYVDAYMTWWRKHTPQTCPATLAELAAFGADQGQDPWHDPYVMRCDTTGFQVLSAGPDQKLGTADDIEAHR